MAKFIDFDDYISKAQPFAQPILSYIRTIVLEEFPELHEEFKWSMPSFTYNGKIILTMASFKAHLALNFWLAEYLKDPYHLFDKRKEGGMGQLGKITSLEDLPEKKIIIEYIHEVIQLTQQGKKISVSKSKKQEVEVPALLAKALLNNKEAEATFNSFSTSNRREYIDWITEAKTENTKQKRLQQAIEWMSEGKPKNWKYMKKYQV